MSLIFILSMYNLLILSKMYEQLFHTHCTKHTYLLFVLLTLLYA